MKSPLWILNSILLALLGTTLAYVFFSSRQLPTQPSLRIATAEVFREQARKPLEPSFLKTIYEDNDLFGTFERKAPEVEEKEKVAPPPKPPKPKPVIATPPPKVSFLEPLKVTVTGILVSTEESENQVIIADESKQEKLYKVGDKIIDAYILRIFKNKVIFIRSNGQQETIYINAAEAQAEIKAMQVTEWESVVQKISENRYIVDTLAFAQRVTNLAQFIDMLDLTTVFSKGVSIGCRVGKVDKNSIGASLGFQTGDIIVSVNDIQPTTTAQRVEIYNLMRKLEANETIDVLLIRRKRQAKLSYTVGTLKTSQKANLPGTKLPISKTEVASDKPVLQVALNDLGAKKDKLQKDMRNFSRPVSELKKRDKQVMARHGGKSSIFKNIPK